MQKFLLKFSYFSIPLLSAYLLIEYANRNIPNEYLTKIENFERSVNDIEVLVFGSSHALRGINPDYFTDYYSFNMGMVGQPMQIDFEIFDKYKKQLNNLKVLIISISHFTLSTNISEGRIAKRVPYYQHFYKLDLLSHYNLNRYTVLPSVGFKKATVNCIKFCVLGKKRKIETNRYGYMGEGGLLVKDSLSFLTAANEAALLHKDDNSYDIKNNLILLNRIIAWTSARNIKVFLIETPKTNEFQDIRDIKKTDLIDSTLFLLDSVNPNVTYQDYTELFKYKKYFRNPDHLNDFGAKEFTLVLNSKINELFKE